MFSQLFKVLDPDPERGRCLQAPDEVVLHSHSTDKTCDATASPLLSRRPEMSIKIQKTNIFGVPIQQHCMIYCSS